MYSCLSREELTRVLHESVKRSTSSLMTGLFSGTACGKQELKRENNDCHGNKPRSLHQVRHGKFNPVWQHSVFPLPEFTVRVTESLAPAGSSEAETRHRSTTDGDFSVSVVFLQLSAEQSDYVR